jgi:hypothetical protein
MGWTGCRTDGEMHGAFALPPHRAKGGRAGGPVARDDSLGLGRGEFNVAYRGPSTPRHFTA